MLSRCLNYIGIETNKRQTERIKEDLIKNLNSKGIRISFVQVNLNSKKLMIRLNFESKAG